MKIRGLLLLAGGIAIGYRLNQRLHEDDPDVLHAPPSARRSPQLRPVNDQALRISDKATVLSLGAIRKTREAIQARLAAEPDDAAWN